MFERELGIGGKLDGAIGGVGAHVCKLFFATDIDVDVLFFV